MRLVNIGETATRIMDRHASSHEWMVWINHRLIAGDGAVGAREKADIADRLLAARAEPDRVKRFLAGFRSPWMYPAFFVPPFNHGKKLPTILGQRPGTHIFSANSHELEILRLLVLFAPDDPKVRDMAARTLDRLRTTCFGFKGCEKGECFDASLAALRFLAAATPGEREWMEGLIQKYHQHFHDKKRSWQIKWYYGLCLSELPEEMARYWLARYPDQWPRPENAPARHWKNDSALAPALAGILRRCPGHPPVAVPAREARLRLPLTYG